MAAKQYLKNNNKCVSKKKTTFEMFIEKKLKGNLFRIVPI